jgi:hypothetical protein
MRCTERAKLICLKGNPSYLKADADHGQEWVAMSQWTTVASTSGSIRSILLKNSFSMQRRLFSVWKCSQKIREKHDVRLAKED